MGGDLDKIRIVGQYFIEVWKAAGMKISNVKFLWAFDEINKKSKTNIQIVLYRNNLYTCIETYLSYLYQLYVNFIYKSLYIYIDRK